ncbi:MAG: class I SAM-dependent methyltransferase [Akkermansia sp.]
MISEMTMNAGKPQETEAGNAMLERMNSRHNEMALWALGYLDFSVTRDILDVGCGGGRNIQNMVQMSQAHVQGIDYSTASVKKSKETNAEAIAAGRVDVMAGSADALPFAPQSFDIITAFETIYYWPNILQCFTNIRELLREGGTFMVFNEDYHPDTESNREVMAALQATMHTPEQLVELFTQAGFRQIELHLHDNGKWLCICGKSLRES